MYPLLRHGDRLPTVAVVQILLNRNMRKGTFIAVDGIYGRNTRGAVREYQRRHPSLGEDGVVGKNTWKALTTGERLAVIDSVDITNPKDMGYEDDAIRRAGGRPLIHYGMSNGVRVAMQKIQARASGHNTVLLRFHGHGAPGVMGVSVGTDAEISSEFGVRFLSSLARFVAPLAWVFSPMGSAELHGCRVGAGKDGRRLVSALSNAWGVPVSAGLRSQYGGGLSTFRFEGPVFTAFPAGKDLKTWARSLPAPEVHGMSVDR